MELSSTHDSANHGYAGKDPNANERSIYKGLMDRVGGTPLAKKSIDNESPEADNPHMNSQSREESNAKIEAVEARMDARVASIEGKIDGMMVRMDERDKRFDDRFSSIQSDITTMKRDMSDNSRSLKFWLAGTVIATVGGLYAANLSMIQTMFGAFESGKSQATAITQATEQMKQTQEQLKSIEERLAKQAAEPK